MWVVLFHAHEGGHLPGLTAALPHWLATPVFECGQSGVAIFFSLSGFVIAHSLRDSRAGGNELLTFLGRRCIRLAPPYYVSMAFVVAAGALSAHVHARALLLPDGKATVSHLFYLQGLLGHPQISDVYWTLCYEMQFYVSYCLLLGIARWVHGREQQVLLAAAVVSLPWGLGIGPAAPGWFIDLWYSFLLGVLSYQAATRRTKWSGFLLFAVPILLSGIVRGDRFAMVASTTSIALGGAMAFHRMGRWLTSRSIQFIGLVSYSLYLTHNQVSGAGFFLMKKLLGTSPAAEVLALGVVIAACLAVSYVMWRFVERPCHVLSRRVGKSWEPVAAPVSAAASA